MPRPTQSDIARLLGVSRVAVTQALKGGGRLSPDLRARILTAAKHAGYQPNAASTAILTGCFGSIGLLLGTDPQASVLGQDTIWGIEDALERREWHLIIQRLSDDELGRGSGLPKALRMSLVDGLIVNYTHHVPSEASRRLAGMPTVWLNTRDGDCCIHGDDRGAARDGTLQLLAAGHQRIVYTDFTGPGERQHYSFTDRWLGYAEAMRSAGRRPQRVLGTRTIPVQERVAAALALLDSARRPTAVVTWQAGLCALPIVAAARILGLRVPTDLALLTFDNCAAHLLDCPVLTAVIPERAIGRQAVELLARRIAGETCPQAMAVPLELAGGKPR